VRVSVHVCACVYVHACVCAYVCMCLCSRRIAIVRSRYLLEFDEKRRIHR
jgi:hypothetical protein